MLLSVHIPKTAGASFRRILAQLFEEDFILKYWQMTDARGRVIAAIPPNVRCVHGHFPPDELLEEFPRAELITWVRDPIERVISSYHHRLREPDWTHPVTRELHERKLSLVQFAALELMRNEMSRYFGSRRPEDFSFIGITEDFEASFERFLRRFNFRRVAIPRDNCNPHRTTERYDIDPETRRAIAALNEQDVSLYREICQAVGGVAKPACYATG